MSVRQVSPYTPIQANSQTMNLDPSLKSAHIYCRVCEQELKITRENLSRSWYGHPLCDEHATRFQQIQANPRPLCEKIEKICKNRHLTFVDLYRLSGFHRGGWLAEWKRGTAPALKSLECIAHSLSITLPSLLDQQETVDTVTKRALSCQVCKHEGFKYEGIIFCDKHKAEYIKQSEKDCKYFGNKIRQLISGLTQKQAGARFGVAPQTMSNFFKKGRQPTPEKLCLLAAGFGEPLSYFFDKDIIDASKTLTQTPQNERYLNNTASMSTSNTVAIPLQQPTMRETYVSGLHYTFASPMEFGSCEQNLPMHDQNNYIPNAQSTAAYVALINAEQRDIWEDYNMRSTDDDSSDFVPANELNVSQDEELFSDQEVSNFFDTLPKLEESLVEDLGLDH